MVVIILIGTFQHNLLFKFLEPITPEIKEIVLRKLVNCIGLKYVNKKKLIIYYL
jgi:hypothetical protein